jgi:hypothetical protein
MKIRTTFVLAAATLVLGVPLAAATPDGSQPQLHSTAEPDAVDRYLANAFRHVGETDAIDRYLHNRSLAAESVSSSTGAGRHPDSLAVRRGAIVPVDAVEAEGFSWTGVALGTLGGALIVLLAFVGASAMRERRRLVFR